MEPDVVSEPLAKAQEAGEQRSGTFRKRVIIWALLVAIAIMGFWFKGSFDEPLSSVGLNKNTCYTSFGATFCGDDLVKYGQNLGYPITSEEAASAYADLSSSVAAAEAYYSHSGGYEGMTADRLREIDSGLPDITVYGQAESYCLETAGGAYHWNGSGGSGPVFWQGSC